MKKKVFYSLILALTLGLCACQKTDKDQTPPVISSEDFTPENCDIYYLGDTVKVHFSCTDNKELGNFNIEIHSNFDHHTHSTEAGSCEEEHEQSVDEHIEEEHSHLQGWIYNKDFSIPEDQTSYIVDLEIVVPEDAEEGDYHFMLRLTDKTGWQTIKSASIKIIKS